jgi:type IV pilus assembly protein PilY1
VPSIRRTLALLLAAAAAAPTAASATNRNFASGSLIIPASLEYQSDTGVLATYGLVYAALWKNATAAKPITFYWAVQPQKLSQYRCDTTTPPKSTDPSSPQFLTGRNAPPLYSPTYNDNDGCDFAVSNAVSKAGNNYVGGQPVSLLTATKGLKNSFSVNDIAYVAGVGPSLASTTHVIDSSTPTVKYLGGAWIIDATDRQAFLDLLANAPELAPFHANGSKSSLFVKIHSANQNFSAPVASVISAKPPQIALLGSNQTTFLTDVLNNAGICTAIPNCGGTFSASGFTSGVVYDYYANAGDLLDSVSGYPNGRLNGTVNNQTYGLVWAGDGASPTAPEIGTLAYYLNTKGNTLFAEYDSPYNIEGTANRFQTTTGLSDYTPDIASYEDCNDQYLAAGSKFLGNGGACLVYCNATNSSCAGQPYSQTGNFTFDGGQGSYKGYTPLDKFATGVQQVLQVGGGGPTISSAYYKDNNIKEGLIMYLAGHKFDNGRFWGERLILNTIFNRLNPYVGIEIARSEPTGFQNNAATQTTQRVYQGSYMQLAQPDSADVTTFRTGSAQNWQFPYTTGHLYEYDLSNIATSAQSFSKNTNWDAAAQLPLPDDRTIWTAIGSGPNPLALPLGSGPLQWTLVNFRAAPMGGNDSAGRPLNEVGAFCTDANGDGYCDLAQLLAACNSAGVTTATLQKRNPADSGAQALQLGLLISQARGHCASHSPAISGTPNLEASDAQCDSTSQTNRAALGGIDHSDPAVVGPSPFISGTPWNTRPVVAYAAGHDGMLHAFFVSSSDGQKTSSWSAEGYSMPSGVKPGQELWAFIPPGQVCGIATNNALVDGNINVVDVFGDFPNDANNDGSIDWTSKGEQPNHQRRWRTVLTATAGAGGSEIFALDVTNPLKPILLWHIGGPTEQDGRWDSNLDGKFGSGEAFDKPGIPNDPSQFAIKWYDWDDQDSSTDYIPTNYNTTDLNVLNELKTGRYDYRNLGESSNTAVAKLWNGSTYQYLMFVATNAADYTTQPGASTEQPPAGFRGAEVFAIDVVTGQKVWQWEHFYSQLDGSGVDNSMPPRVALGDLDSNGSLDRIYVGDLEGHLWELSASDGHNLNYLLGSDRVYHSFPLFGTPAMTGAGPPAADANTLSLFQVGGSSSLSQQPLTTPIGLGRFTSVPPQYTNYLLNRLSVIVGTMGVDWAISPYEPGNIFVIPISPQYGTRLPVAPATTIDMSQSPSPLTAGVLLPAAAWKIPLAVGERVYSTPQVVNNTIVFNTAFGTASGDISMSLTDPGNLQMISGDKNGTHLTTVANDSKSFGGVLIMGGKAVVSTDDKIVVAATPPAISNAPNGVAGLPTSTYQHVTPATLHSWEVSTWVVSQ